MKVPKNVFVPFVLSVLLLSPMAALAQIWTYVASAAAVDELSFDKYEAIGGSFIHRSGAIGYIYARCNVTNPLDNGAQNPGWNCLEVTYRDPDGQSLGNSVAAYLYRVSNSTGAATQISRFNSNSFGASSSVQTNHVSFAHNFDFVSNAYFVYFTVYRAVTAGSSLPAAFVFRLTHCLVSSGEEGGDDTPIPEPGSNPEYDELQSNASETEASTTNALDQNHPNPFNPSTSIQFEVKQAGRVTLKVYNSLGQEVADLLDKHLPAGRHSATFDATSLPSGVYFYRLSGNGFNEVKKMELIK